MADMRRTSAQIGRNWARYGVLLAASGLMAGAVAYLYDRRLRRNLVGFVRAEVTAQLMKRG